MTSNDDLNDLNIELAKSYVYVERVSIEKGDKSNNDWDAPEKALKEYINKALNEIYIKLEDGNKFVPFFKAEFHKCKNDEKHDYSIHFHLISFKIWDDNKTEIETCLVGSRPKNATFTSSLIENLQTMYRDPTATDNLLEEEKPSSKNIPGKNVFEKFLYYWLVVPKVQWDFFDLLYQMYTFDIFHQGFIAKFVHFLTIPTNAMLSMMFLAQFDIPTVGELRYGHAFAVNFGLILFIVLAIAYIVMGVLRKSVLWGFATAIVLAVLNMAGNLWYYSYRVQGNPWYNPTTTPTNPLIWSYSMSILQALSHIKESQIPPRISGVNHWESLHLFFRNERKTHSSTREHIMFKYSSLALFPVLSTSVAWFSWPHLIGTEVIYIMAGIGYRPRFFANYSRIIEKAKLQGNPILDKFPIKFSDIRLQVPVHQIKTLKTHRVVKENVSDKDLMYAFANLELMAMYVRRGIRQPKMEQSDKVIDPHLRLMLAAINGQLQKPKEEPENQNKKDE